MTNERHLVEDGDRPKRRLCVLPAASDHRQPPGLNVRDKPLAAQARGVDGRDQRVPPDGDDDLDILGYGIVPEQLDSFVLICYDCTSVIMELFVLCKDARQWSGLFRKNSIDSGV